MRLPGCGGAGGRGFRAVRRGPTRDVGHGRTPVGSRGPRPPEGHDQGEDEDRRGEDAEPLPVPACPGRPERRLPESAAPDRAGLPGAGAGAESEGWGERGDGCGARAGTASGGSSSTGPDRAPSADGPATLSGCVATPCRSRRSPSASSHRRCSSSRSSAGAPHNRASRSTGANSAGTVRPVQYRCSVEPLTPMRRASDAYVRPDPSRSALSRSASTTRAAPSASPDTLDLPCRRSRAFQPSENTHVTRGGTVPARPEAVACLSGSGAAAQAGARSVPPPCGPTGLRTSRRDVVRTNGRTVRIT
ncbi:hypothetical protein SBADM41S_03599 [Streptomyces badius]